MPETPLIYTIGHSNHTIETFIALLKRYEITRVMDVRSQPYSRWASQFNRETLRESLQEAGIEYHFMGDKLGGRPKDTTLYDPGESERPNYKRVAQTPSYQEGIAHLLKLAQDDPVTIMCSEGDHEHCHRHRLITQTLLEYDTRVLHIQPDGSTVEGARIAEQLALF